MCENFRGLVRRIINLHVTHSCADDLHGAVQNQLHGRFELHWAKQLRAEPVEPIEGADLGGELGLALFRYLYRTFLVSHMV